VDSYTVCIYELFFSKPRPPLPIQSQIPVDFLPNPPIYRSSPLRAILIEIFSPATLENGDVTADLSAAFPASATLCFVAGAPAAPTSSEASPLPGPKLTGEQLPGEKQELALTKIGRRK
jgi:hypothetical protein